MSDTEHDVFLHNQVGVFEGWVEGCHGCAPREAMLTLQEAFGNQFQSEDPVERVIELWLHNDCWIPGADYARLAAALKVPVDRLMNDRTRRV